jgi:hypothetical protein
MFHVKHCLGVIGSPCPTFETPSRLAVACAEIDTVVQSGERRFVSFPALLARRGFPSRDLARAFVDAIRKFFIFN